MGIYLRMRTVDRKVKGSSRPPCCSQDGTGVLVWLGAEIIADTSRSLRAGMVSLLRRIYLVSDFCREVHQRPVGRSHRSYLLSVLCRPDWRPRNLRVGSASRYALGRR